MAMFNSYVKLPEGTWGFPEMEKKQQPDGLERFENFEFKIPSRNGWFGGSPSLGNLHIYFWCIHDRFNRNLI